MNERIALIGHLTRDVIHASGRTISVPGGTVHYAGMAYARLGLAVGIFTKLAPGDADELTEPLRSAGCRVHVVSSRASTQFENSLTPDLRQRSQRVRALADSFESPDLALEAPTLVHLGPLTNTEMHPDFVLEAAERAARLVLDVQGFVRRLEGEQVVSAPFEAASRVLPACHIVKADAEEALVITGERDPARAARALNALGAKEVLVTLAERGSYVAAEGGVLFVPPFRAEGALDSTGAGDTYTAGYVFARLRGDAVFESARFASALASLSVERTGAFTGTLGGVEERLRTPPLA